MERKPRYSGGIETRTESDVTNFETKRCWESSNKLKRAGCLIPVEGKRLFHGRAHEGGNFEVDPFFDNAGNATGNRNINRGLTALHVAPHETARKFAEARARQKGTMAEIAEVEIPDKEASFFDMNQSLGERSDHLDEIKKAFTESLPSILQGTILSADDYKTLDQNRLAELIRTSTQKTAIYDERFIPMYAKSLGISEAGVRKVLGAINTRNCVAGSRDSHEAMYNCISAMMHNPGEIGIDLPVNGKMQNYPISRDYIQQWMRDMHIIGVRCGIRSATLHGEVINDTYQIFNLETVRSKEQDEKAREARMRAFGGATYRINRLLNNRSETHNRDNPLTYIDMDRRVSPTDLIESAKRVSIKYQRIFESSAGNWEGYTLEEHTETALRIFDTSYKSNLPRSVYDLGRLCLLVHDIGKPIARKNGEAQDPYNAEYSRMFLKDIGAPTELVSAIPDIVTVGKEASDRFMLSKTDEERTASRKQLYQTSASIVRKMFGIDERSSDFKSCVSTLSALCRTLSICDGAAYSTYASTQKKNGLRHHNMNKRFDATYNSASANPDYMRPKQ
jgi:hypothetical protein